jgi:hypothetical protein
LLIPRAINILPAICFVVAPLRKVYFRLSMAPFQSTIYQPRLTCVTSAWSVSAQVHAPILFMLEQWSDGCTMSFTPAARVKSFSSRVRSVAPLCGAYALRTASCVADTQTQSSLDMLSSKLLSFVYCS